MVNIIYHFFIYHYLWVSNTYWPDQPGKWFSKLIPKSRNVTMLNWEQKTLPTPKCYF